MKLIFFSLFTLALVSVANANSFSDEKWETKTYNIGDFTEIYLEGGYKVFLAQGEQNSVKVKTDDSDVFEYLQVRTDGRKLKINIEPDHLCFDRIVLYITFRQIEKLKIEGGVKLETKGYLDLNNFEMYVAGGAKIELNLKAENIEIIGEGGVIFVLEGVAKSLDLYVSGAAHIDAEELKSEDVEIKIEGVGTATVYATKTLDARIEGVGRIKYSGNPKVTKRVEGLGSVTRN